MVKVELIAVISTMPRVISFIAAKVPLIATVEAIIIENSPREESNAPILFQLVGSVIPLPSHQPSTNLPAMPTIEKTSTTGSTATKSAKEMLSPKNRKKIAAKISLSGANL